jgi:hypothetical protein
MRSMKHKGLFLLIQLYSTLSRFPHYGTSVFFLAVLAEKVKSSRSHLLHMMLEKWFVPDIVIFYIYLLVEGQT